MYFNLKACIVKFRIRLWWMLTFCSHMNALKMDDIKSHIRRIMVYEFRKIRTFIWILLQLFGRSKTSLADFIWVILTFTFNHDPSDHLWWINRRYIFKSITQLRFVIWRDMLSRKILNLSFPTTTTQDNISQNRTLHEVKELKWGKNCILLTWLLRKFIWFLLYEPI